MKTITLASALFLTVAAANALAADLPVEQAAAMHRELHGAMGTMHEDMMKGMMSNDPMWPLPPGCCRTISAPLRWRESS
nr:hypothetical protein [Edwardsiella ictaluri]